ncbi:hypothetical protein [Bacillus sp. REN10]|uniref:hypothetical protein n=1 Tax=Bacillus sp. REN10 TaxID=2782541 RepID=UPI00193B6371|nr:hypothetical protein [Bacillus sp. REN10]
MTQKLFGVEFSSKEISIDETGKVVINNPNLAKAIKGVGRLNSLELPNQNCGGTCNNATNCGQFV